MTEKQTTAVDVNVKNPAKAARKIKILQPALYAGLVVILALVPMLNISSYILHILILTFIYIVAAVSLRFVITSGQYPLAHGAFMAMGAYTSAVTAKLLGWPLWLTIPLGGVVAMLIGAFIAYPFARLRAFYYAMVSLFFGLGVIQIIIVLTKWTSGSGGLVNIPHLLPGTSKVPYYYFFLAFMVVCLLALWRFEFSRFGITLKAIAQSHMVASSVGISEVWYRVMALAIGCFFVGVTGATYAHYNFTLSPTSFDMMASFWLFIYVLIGGVKNFAGPIIGTALLVITPLILNSLKQYVPYISAAILMIVFYVMHDGLVGLPRIIMSRFGKTKPGSGNKEIPAPGS